MHLCRQWYSRRDLAANLTIVVLLSFGLGAASLLYTALERLLLHPLPFAHPETLVRFAERRPPVLSWSWFPYRSFQAMQHLASFANVAAEGEVETVLTTPAGAQPLFAAMVSGEYFTMLGQSPELGRALGSSDEQQRSGTVAVVLSHRLWMRQFGGAASVLGNTLQLQSHSYTVVGVMPARFFGSRLDEAPDLWLPFTAQPLLSNKPLNDPDPDRYFSILARLRPGTTLAQAQSEFKVVYRTLQAKERDPDPKREPLILPIAHGSFGLRDQFGHALTLLLGGLLVLLLMLAANVAALLLVRANGREREIAIRIALGASRARVLRDTLLRSAGLGLAGACGGLALARICAPWFTALLPVSRTPLPVSLSPDGRIALLAVFSAVAVSLIFSVVPAWLGSRIAPQHALRRGTATSRLGPLLRSLLSLQTAVTWLLLVAAGLLLHTFYALEHTSPGFDVQHLIAFTVDPASGGRSTQLSPTFASDLQQRMEQLPGVRSASLSSAALMQRLGLKTSVALTGQRIPERSFLNTSLDQVSPNFFVTLGIPLLAGASFSDADAARSGPTPTVINEAFARLLFPREDPLGKTFGNGEPGTTAAASNLVVGIAGDSKYRSLREPLLPIYYTPAMLRDASTSWGPQFYLYVRTWSPPSIIISAARRILSGLDPQLAFSNVATMQEQVSESLWQERLLAVLAVVFAVVSILVASTGLYGLLSEEAARRTREFGIRTAVGARKRDVLMLLGKDLARIVGAGVAAGSIASLALARFVLRRYTESSRSMRSPCSGRSLSFFCSPSYRAGSPCAAP